MAATGFHAEQITTFSEQLSRYFEINSHTYIGSFVYYREGDITKSVAPDIYVVFGVAKTPERRSFYTWAEGVAPVAVFEFLSDSTAHRDRDKKVGLYLNDIGVQEYFIHQPELKKPAEFHGWQRSPSGNIIEIVQDAEGGLFSEALNLWFRWKDDHTTDVRLLRPYLPDGTPITTSIEEAHLHQQEKDLREQEKYLRVEAEAMAAAEAERRRELEIEIERLRTQLADKQNETP
jgi:Uma2 family endonuclease